MNDPKGSPWFEEHPRAREMKVLTDDEDADVVIVGGGISGLATTYQLAAGNDLRITLLEAGVLGHGATGNNGGQAVEGSETGFEEIATTAGWDRARQGFRELAEARPDLKDMLRDIGSPELLNEVTGRLGIADPDLIEDWGREADIMREAGLSIGGFNVAEDAPPGLLGNVLRTPRDTLAEQLWSKDRRYIASLEVKIGLINTYALVEAIAAHLLSRDADRISIYERSPASLMRFSDDDVTISCNGRIVVADSVVLCTNGYVPPRTEACSSAVIRGAVRGVVGYMVGSEGGSGPEGARAYLPGGESYYYVARRRYLGGWLTASGGPEGPISGPYDSGTVYHPGAYDQLESFLSSTLEGYSRPASRRWQGLMGYTATGARIAGQDPQLPCLHYNLGCNGIGILSALAGARRLAGIMGGQDMEPSMFDPEVTAEARLRANGLGRESRP